MRESHIEKTCKKLAEAEGYNVRKIKFIAQSGCPDRIFFKRNILFWVEFKNETGIISPIQKYQFNLLVDSGQRIFLVDSIEQFNKILKEIK